LRMDSPWNIAQHPTETKKLAPWRFLFIVYMVRKVWLLTATVLPTHGLGFRWPPEPGAQNRCGSNRLENLEHRRLFSAVCSSLGQISLLSAMSNMLGQEINSCCFFSDNPERLLH
jgi:hypothetical protein